MKRKNIINILLVCMTMLTAWTFSACDDTMGGEATLGFPTDTLFVEAVPSDTVDVTFNVGYDWNITSDKEWCRVDGEYKNLRGKAGKNTVKFVISEFGDLFLADTAMITLHMNEDSRVIACIARCATKEYAMEVRDGEKALLDGESIVIGTTGSLKLELDPNFDVDRLKYAFPEWIKMEREGKLITLNVKEESLKYVIDNEEDSLCFYKDNTVRRSFHIEYVGMSPREIRIGSKIESTLVVSLDAKRAYVDDVKCQLPITFTVAALNDKFEIISLAYAKDRGCYVLANVDRWFAVDSINGNVRLSGVKENTEIEERMAHLLVLPQEIGDSLDGDAAVLGYLCDEVDGVMKLKEDAEQYRLVTIAQDGVANITITPEAQWNVKVASDGKSFVDVIKGDTCFTPMEVEIETHRGYELICATYDATVGYTLIKLEESWLDINDDKQGNVSIGFTENAANERALLLMALPLPIVESLEPESSDYWDNLSRELFEEVDGLNELKMDAEQFVIAKFIQEPNEGNSIKVLKKGVESIEVTKETDAEWLAIAANPNDSLSGVAPNKVFHCSMKLGYSYMINPLIPLEEWGGDGFQEDKRGIEIYDKSGKKYEPGKGNDYVDDYGIMEDIEGNYMLVTLTADRKKMTEEFIIYFIDRERKCLKALVVTLL